MRNAARLAVLLVATAAVPAQAAYEFAPVFHPIGGPMVFDGQRTLMVSKGRPLTSGGQYGREIWSLQGSAWSYVAPGFAEIYVMAHDPVRNRIVALEGSSTATMWQWNGTTWSQISMPGPLNFCRQWQLCWDPTRAATVVLGYDLTNDVCELWSYGTAGWQQLSSSPGPQWGTYRLVPLANGDLLWIGQRWSTNLPETWRWSAGTWTQLASPPATGEAVSDPVTLQPYLVSAPLFGSVDIWTFNGVSWSLVANGPALSPVTAVHDGQRIVLHGGHLLVGTPASILPDGQTWRFQNGVFTPIATPQPQVLQARRAVYDSWRGGTLVVGWFNGNRETWQWNGSVFVLLDRTPRPSSLLNLAFDDLRGVAVLLESDGTTAEWNGVSWTTIGGAGFGPARPRAGMAFDGQRVVLFGGHDDQTFQTWNETWLYDGISWTQWVGPSPPWSNGGERQLVHDPSRGRTVLIGGDYGSLYEWNGTGWLTAAATPWLPTTMPRSRFFAGFHPARGRVVFGGGRNGVGGGEVGVWEWNGTALSPLPQKFAIGAVLAPETSGDAILYGHGDWQQTALVDRLVSVHPASLEPFGNGCAGTAGVPGIAGQPWHAPWLGGALQLRCATIPAPGVAFWVMGFSTTMAGGVPLPADLGLLGAPGCSELVSVDWVQFALASGGAVTLNVSVPPSAPGLVGQRAHVQVLVADPPANAAGFVVSNGMTATIGVH